MMRKLICRCEVLMQSCISTASEQDYLIRELVRDETASTNGHREKPSRRLISLDTINVDSNGRMAPRPGLRPLGYGR